ncbi:MAG: hypothetical protein KF757_06780 [Phycisphaeraceae bacterium]|nr:hypothetical protein [Phycisphaeraceae bacterium]MCW5763309.1 hypothetical protein [Phycisphaeraceae bacterium]
MSILSVCGECGLPVKASILALVDPHADELQPIEHPRLIQIGVLLWTFAAFCAAVLNWVIRACEFSERFFGISADVVPLSRFYIGSLIASGLGAIAIIRPHAGLDRRNVRRAILGVLCYAPLIAAAWYMFFRIDPYEYYVYSSTTEMPMLRIALRLVFGISLIAMVLLLHSNALILAHRSVLVRSGRVDRQPLRALAAAAGIALIGDLTLLIQTQFSGPITNLLYTVGVILVAAGSFLLTVALWGVTLDAWRIRRVIMAPGIGLTDIFDDRT